MDFHYTIEITAEPEEVFAALTVPFQIELWSGYPVLIVGRRYHRG